MGFGENVLVLGQVIKINKRAGTMTVRYTEADGSEVSAFLLAKFAMDGPHGRISANAKCSCNGIYKKKLRRWEICSEAGDWVRFFLKALNDQEFRTCNGAGWAHRNGGRIPFVGINVCVGCGFGSDVCPKETRKAYNITGDYPVPPPAQQNVNNNGGLRTESYNELADRLSRWD